MDPLHGIGALNPFRVHSVLKASSIIGRGSASSRKQFLKFQRLVGSDSLLRLFVQHNLLRLVRRGGVYFRGILCFFVEFWYMDLLVRRVPRMTLRQFGLSLIKSTTMAKSLASL